MAVEISSREELEAWLEGKSDAWAQAIALRSTLRVIPLACNPVKWRGQKPNGDAVLTAFRATAILIATTRYLSSHDIRAISSLPAASKAVSSASSSAASNTSNVPAAVFATARAATAGATTIAVYASINAVNAANTALSASRADSVVAAIWQNLSFDCAALDETKNLTELLEKSLWVKQLDWFDAIWNVATGWLSLDGEGFKIWREWYFGWLDGEKRHAFASFDEKADVAFYQKIAEYDDAWWSRPPAEVNADIAALVDSLRSVLEPPEPAIPRVDYFISYTSKDEPAAREIADVLDELGKSYIVQYRDFKQRDFAVAMNDALSRSERIIPLYSKGYVRSDHCLAEWNHYYKLDPSFEDRKVVGFLLEPTDLPPLMDRVNYQSLMDLTGARRRIAIREWIEPSTPRTTRDWVRGVLMSTISPQIVHDNDNRLVLAPNPVFDEPEFPDELASALIELKMLLELVRDQTFNLSSFMQRALKRYDETIEDAGANAHWGALHRMMAIVSDGLEQMRDEEFSAGQKSTLTQIVAVHNHCMTSLRNPDERANDTASIPAVNGDAADLSAVVKGLEEISVELKTDDRTSEEFDNHVGDFISEGREFQYEASTLQEGEKPSWAMRRYILNVGGFGFGLLTALGSIASISTTPAGKAALAAAQKLVDDFYRIIGL